MEDFVIKLLCTHCGQKISVPKIGAGKKGKCPKCKNIVVIPEAEDAAPAADQSNFSGSKKGAKYVGFDHALFDIPPEDATANQLSSQGSVSEKDLEELQRPAEGLEKDKTGQIGKRKLPWIIDIFLYPMSFWGLVNLGIFIGIILFLDTVGEILPYYFAILFWLLTLVIRIFVVLFMYWYFAACVRDSAEGGLRAPKVIGDVPPAGDMLRQMVDIIGCLVVFLAPSILYVLMTFRTDVIFWLLLIYGIFLFPMALLGIVVFDSMAGLNPRIIYKSISNTFWQYCGLILLFVAAVLAIVVLGQKAGESGHLVILVHCSAIYLIFVAAHLLGRFYWRYQEKLNWEVADS
ncbi:MAG: hypothetical protein FVQ85_02055 [Planctomycetes bacterium]|nr:hypothetical protein [Planctomycetota bacterium]